MDMRQADNGIEFLAAVGASFGVFSGVHSSLWSAQNFGDTPETAASCKSYAWIAAAATIGFMGTGSLITGSPYALYGGVLVSALMLLGYRRSLAKASHDDAPAQGAYW